jgi:folate-binding protein YgfZ
VPRQTGDVTSSPSVIDDNARDHVFVVGPDAQKYLHSQISQDILGLPVGGVTWTLVLEPTGKVESLARLTRTGEESFDLDTDAGYGEALAARLRRFKIRVDAEITIEPASSAEPTAEHETARVAAGWPRLGFEIVPGETIPAVTGVVALTVSFTKGCYPGQELVERMDSRGADAPRMLRIVDVDPGATVGNPVLADDGTEIAVLTSVSPDGELALALVKRGHDIGRPPTHTP